MAKDFRPKLLLSELSLFAIVQVIALFVGYKLISTQQLEYLPTNQAIYTFLAAIFVASIIIFLFLRFLKGPWSAKIFFAFILFVGINIVFSAFFSSLVAIVLSIGIVAVRFYKPNVLLHNIVMFLALAGVGARLGTMIPVFAVIVLLIILSVYDFIAVFKTKHMVTMFKGMLEKGIPMGIVIPEDASHMSHDMGKVSVTKLRQKKKRDFIMLGGGDLAFPAIFAVSALAQYGLAQALGVLVGALGGIVLIHTLIVKKEYKALPALPPLAAFSIIGFLITLIPSLL